MAQNLSFLRIYADGLLDDASIPPSPGLTSRVLRISNELGRSISAVRTIAYDLRPPDLEELGLAKTLFRFTDEFAKRHGIEIDFRISGLDAMHRNGEVEINIYRMIQEALHNIARHAEADHVTIRVTSAHPHLLVRIEDNGIGFDIGQMQLRNREDKRMGVQGMQERIALLGGHLEIDSSPQNGTRLMAEIPMPGTEDSPLPGILPSTEAVPETAVP